MGLSPTTKCQCNCQTVSLFCVCFWYEEDDGFMDSFYPRLVYIKSLETTLIKGSSINEFTLFSKPFDPLTYFYEKGKTVSYQTITLGI